MIKSMPKLSPSFASHQQKLLNCLLEELARTGILLYQQLNVFEKEKRKSNFDLNLFGSKEY